jgi:hypothetical protein
MHRGTPEENCPGWRQLSLQGSGTTFEKRALREAMCSPCSLQAQLPPQAPGQEPNSHWEFRAGLACMLCQRNATQLISPPKKCLKCLLQDGVPGFISRWGNKVVGMTSREQLHRDLEPNS